MKQSQDKVFVSDIDDYTDSDIYAALKNAFLSLGIGEEEIKNKKAVIKPNLVMAAPPESGATVHPSVVLKTAEILREFGAESVILADSPGGPYNAATFGHICRICGMSGIEGEALRLNDDFTWKQVHFDGIKLKNFECITPVYDADVVIDLCKLKTHALTGLSAAVKNLFGIIPGVLKFEMHSNFPEQDDFSSMLCDLAGYVMKSKKLICICDAIISMEGNGPTHGKPKKTGLLLASRSPFALDVVCEHIMRIDGTVKYLNEGAKRGLTARDFSGIEVDGDVKTYDFRRPDSDAGKLLNNLPDLFGGRIADMFRTKPKVNSKKCIGCGKCVSNCPEKTIEFMTGHEKKQAVIRYDKCISCFCCQELCPVGAVELKKNILIKLIH